VQSPQLIWQQADWPAFRCNGAPVAQAVALARRAQGVVEGKLAAIGFSQREQLTSDAWTQEAMSTAAIEGERLDLLAVRSSVARRLSASATRAPSSPRHIEGLLDIMDDALMRSGEPLTHARLHAWQAALFPTGYSGMRKILVGEYRQHAEPMQIVSGALGREKVHYEAPASNHVLEEMTRFLGWFNASSEANQDTESLVRAALAHLWFETVHPFKDGNGRVGRVVVDLVLARDAAKANGVPHASRLIRISQQLLDQRDAYYAELEHAQHGSLDVTRWVVWFVSQIHAACEQASAVIDVSLNKARFWTAHDDKDLSARQRKVVNILLDAEPAGFVGGMNTQKYASITSTSRATASRELIALAELGLLEATGGGRSTRYHLNFANPS
jgi:Fic family protein